MMVTSAAMEADDGTEAIAIHSYRPYFTMAEAQWLQDKQRGGVHGISEARQEHARAQATSLIISISQQVGFPQRTIYKGCMLYHRFFLFYPQKDFAPRDVALAALFVASKMEDTLKKLKELIPIALQIRAAKDMELDRNEVMLEKERQRILGIERLVLQTICFDFNYPNIFPIVLKLCKTLRVSRAFTETAWQVACDRTICSLLYPAVFIAAASIYLAAVLASDEAYIDRIEEALWSTPAISKSSVHETCQLILDLYIRLTGTPVNVEDSSRDYTSVKIRLRERLQYAIEQKKVDPSEVLEKGRERYGIGEL